MIGLYPLKPISLWLTNISSTQYRCFPAKSVSSCNSNYNNNSNDYITIMLIWHRWTTWDNPLQKRLGLENVPGQYQRQREVELSCKNRREKEKRKKKNVNKLVIISTFYHKYSAGSPDDHHQHCSLLCTCMSLHLPVSHWWCSRGQSHRLPLSRSHWLSHVHCWSLEYHQLSSEKLVVGCQLWHSGGRLFDPLGYILPLSVERLKA